MLLTLSWLAEGGGGADGGDADARVRLVVAVRCVFLRPQIATATVRVPRQAARGLEAKKRVDITVTCECDETPTKNRKGKKKGSNFEHVYVEKSRKPTNPE